ncbi:GTP cyclohydrolase, FolE2/MptA family [Mycolicibacterium sp. XJ662]
MTNELPDIQGREDARGIDIDEVGISGLRYPLTFDDGDVVQTGIATVEMTVGLSASQRGTHMSRMVQAVEAHLSVVDPRELPMSFKAIAALLNSRDLRISVALPLATRVNSPVTSNSGFQVHDLELRGSSIDGIFQLSTIVSTDVTTLCPCSKAISDYGAHNQRSRVSLSIDGQDDVPYPVSVANIARLVRDAASCPVYPVVKRPDERAITMAAYDNPKFVEDLIRDLTLSCRALSVSHGIQARNIESIHSHDAVARLVWHSSGSE